MTPEKNVAQFEPVQQHGIVIEKAPWLPTPEPDELVKAPDLRATLTDRGKKYGPFKTHAEITQRLKLVISEGLDRRTLRLVDDQQEALDMICHKIGRIVNGDPNYPDSWHDIAGYAQLVADRLNGVVR